MFKSSKINHIYIDTKSGRKVQTKNRGQETGKKETGGES